MDRAPTVGNARLQVPTATDALHEVTPSVTLTVPVGVPPALTTVKLTGTGSPVTEGSGRSEAMVVVVGAWLTWCGVPAEALPAKLASPA